MKPVFAKKAARPDPELLTLKAELLEAQGDLAQAYRQFGNSVIVDVFAAVASLLRSRIEIAVAARLKGEFEAAS